MPEAIMGADLTKIFGTTMAVDHISFSVKEGEIFGFQWDPTTPFAPRPGETLHSLEEEIFNHILILKGILSRIIT